MSGGKEAAPRLDRAPILLPLLNPPSHAPNARSPPLHLLPSGTVQPSRIVLSRPEQHTMWVSTNHVFPAAYPRSHHSSTCPPVQPYQPQADPIPLPSTSDASVIKAEEGRRRKLDMEEWKARLQRLTMSSHLPPDTATEAQRRAKDLADAAYPQLWGTVQRIVPVRNAPPELPSTDSTPSAEPYTLLLAHATGFHKETWEPMLPHLLETLSHRQDSRGKRIQIDEIWSMDTMGSGESGTLNRYTLGETTSWFDGARDVLQFIHNYLPPAATTPSRTTFGGPRWPDAQLPYCRASEVAKSKLKGRKIIAVGHSYAGAALAMLAGAEPEIFEALFLVDPVMFVPEQFSLYIDKPYKDLEHPAALGAVVRRDVWASPSDAMTYFLSRPFWQAWNRRATDLYARFALRPVYTAPSPHEQIPAQTTSTQPAAWTLAMSKFTEAAMFGGSALGTFGLAALRYGGFKGKAYHFKTASSVQQQADTDAINDACKALGGGYEELDAAHLVVQQQPQLMGEKLGLAMIQLLGAQTSYQAPVARM